MTKNDRKSYKSSTINKPEKQNCEAKRRASNYLKYPLFFAWWVVNNNVRTNRQMASQYLYLPWICLAGGVPGGDGRMIDIEIGR